MRENGAKLGTLKKLSDRQATLIPQWKRGRERASQTTMQSKEGSARLLTGP